MSRLSTSPNTFMFDTASSAAVLGAVTNPSRSHPRVLILFGTRPEAIKLAPVIHELERRSFGTVVVSSSQHKHLLTPFLATLDIGVDYDLKVMQRRQTPTEVCARVLAKLDKILDLERPDLILVQGDTTTTLAGALAGFNRKIPVGHVEAGLRSGNLMSPFPEEMNRRLVTQVATLHFAATEKNKRNLIAENVRSERVFVTGNPVVDSLQKMLKRLAPSETLAKILDDTEGQKRLVLTTHRRESFGEVMRANLETIADFVGRHPDVTVLFPVHPNPNVRAAVRQVFGRQPRVHLLDPLDYSDFLALMQSAWLIVSDSGGVQEEAPSLGKPLLILRENTERPEAITAGVAKLVGSDPTALRRMLEENYSVPTWIKSVGKIANPFGDGNSAARIVTIIERELFPAARLTPKRFALPTNA